MTTQADLPDAPHEVREAMANVRSMLDAQLTSTAQSLSLPREPTIISIVGDRGQGKSTTLAFCAHDLRKAGYMVLPVVEPERFAQGDSLIGWCLAALRQMLAIEVLDSETTGGLPIRRVLDDLVLDNELVESGYRRGLEQRGLPPDQFAREVSRIPAVGIRRAEAWAQLAAEVVENSGYLGIVIPIDDADLRPGILPGLLQDCQMLTSSALVAVLSAFDQASLWDAIRSSTPQELSSVERDEMTHRQIAKYLPHSLRISLHGIPPSQRVEFRPVGDARTLYWTSSTATSLTDAELRRWVTSFASARYEIVSRVMTMLAVCPATAVS